ncbi:hypothetical protein [Bradyrhizobium sp.]
MQTMSIARNEFAAKETNLFNQIAMFSITGLAMSMALFIVCGFPVMSPWS